jgi:hypothetical protein
MAMGNLENCWLDHIIATTGQRELGEPLADIGPSGEELSVKLQDSLLEELERHGWSVTRRKEDLEWWAHETWVLESRWSPHGFKLFLTFLTDPQPGNPNPFFKVGSSVKLPENRFEADREPCLRVTPSWLNDLPRFVADVNALRQLEFEKEQGR